MRLGAQVYDHQRVVYRAVGEVIEVLLLHHLEAAVPCAVPLPLGRGVSVLAYLAVAAGHAVAVQHIIAEAALLLEGEVDAHAHHVLKHQGALIKSAVAVEALAFDVYIGAVQRPLYIILIAVYVENAFILGLKLYGYAALPYVRNVHLYAVHLGGCGVVYAQVGI